jgi:hypothetical protein
MPGKKFLCDTPYSTGRMLIESGRNFCFDVNHAIEMARCEQVDETYVVGGFFGLNPGYFHLGGQNGRKTHLSFSDSTLDLHRLLPQYPDNARITLEVSNDWNRTREDLKLIARMTRDAHFARA